MSLFKVVIFIVIFITRQKNPSHQATFQKTLIFDTTFITKITFSLTIINEYKILYIDVKDIIAFVSLKMKKYYNIKHQF